MILIKKIEIEGFRSFKERTVVDFPDNGLVLLNGRYEDSSVSSGSGKSSILMAIAFALDICDLPATELKNWDSDKLFVKLTLQKDNSIIEIVKNPKLSLTIDDKPFESMIKGAKEKLQELLATSSDLLKALTYRPQRSSGKFITMSDSEIKNFLSEVLGLNEIEEGLSKIDEEIEVKSKQATILCAEINAIESVLSSSSLNSEDLKKAQDDYDYCVKKTQQIQNYNTQETEQEIKLLESKIFEAQNVLKQSNQAVFENKAIRSEILNLDFEIKKLKENICPTCEREWLAQKEKLDSKSERMHQLITKMQVNLSVVKNSEPIIESLERLQNKVSELKSELLTQKAPLRDAIYAKDLAEKNLNSLINLMKAAESNQKKLTSLKHSLEKVEKDLFIKRTQSAVLGKSGFLGVIFDEVLKEIESRSNEMISYLPNISEFSISLSSTSVNKTNGNSKKTISKKVFKDGKEITIKSLSGGQQCGLELCVDLAVTETIKSRQGSDLSWIALDEAMDGLGVNEKQIALGMIKEKVKGLVIIVDHATEIKEAFTKVINIVYNGKESYVTENP